MPVKYLCDPRKNIECTKEGCRWRRSSSSECFCTTHPEYAFDEVPEPICDHDYELLEKDFRFSLIICCSDLSDDINAKCFGEKPKESVPVTFIKKKFDRKDLEDI